MTERGADFECHHCQPADRLSQPSRPSQRPKIPVTCDAVRVGVVKQDLGCWCDAVDSGQYFRIAGNGPASTHHHLFKHPSCAVHSQRKALTCTTPSTAMAKWCAFRLAHMCSKWCSKARLELREGPSSSKFTLLIPPCPLRARTLPWHNPDSACGQHTVLAFREHGYGGDAVRRALA